MRVVIHNYFNNSHSSLGSLDSWSPDFNTGSVIGDMQAGNKLYDKTSFDGILCHLLQFGDEPTCYLSLKRSADGYPMSGEEKITYLQRISSELVARGLKIDAVVCADSDCADNKSFPTFFNAAKAIDSNIKTVEVGFRENSDSVADYYTTSDSFSQKMAEAFVTSSAAAVEDDLAAIDKISEAVRSVEAAMGHKKEERRR